MFFVKPVPVCLEFFLCFERVQTLKRNICSSTFTFLYIYFLHLDILVCDSSSSWSCRCPVRKYNHNGLLDLNGSSCLHIIFILPSSYCDIGYNIFHLRKGLPLERKIMEIKSKKESMSSVELGFRTHSPRRAHSSPRPRIASPVDSACHYPIRSSHCTDFSQ